MVSKIAVIALVALVAFPVGLGYALNFEDVEVTTYNEGKATNVTQLLKNGTDTNTVPVNTYDLNTARFYSPGVIASPNYHQGRMPMYNTVSTSTLSSLMTRTTYPNSFPVPTFSASSLMWCQIDTGYNPANPSSYPSITVESNSVLGTFTVDRVAYFYATLTSDNRVYGTVVGYTADGNINTRGAWDVTRIVSWSTTGGFSAANVRYDIMLKGWGASTPNIGYVNLADGFKLDGTYGQWQASGSGVKRLVMTFDLNQVHDGFTLSYKPVYDASSRIGLCTIMATESGGYSFSENSGYKDLIYDSSRSENVYQMVITPKLVELRYIGDWPASFGEVDYYKTWTRTNYSATDDHLIQSLYFYNISGSTGAAKIDKMRFDSALGVSSPYPVIKDNTLNASQFVGDEHSIKMGNITQYGKTLTFGGRTFTVSESDKTIHLDRVDIPLNGIKFDSVLNTNNNLYENRINGTVISSTATPSTLTFGGSWLAAVDVSALTAETTTVTRWVPGAWAWNGLDLNFALVGLVTCVGAFVGLGFYGQRSGGKVGTLMIVCAGGALVFLALL